MTIQKLLDWEMGQGRTDTMKPCPFCGSMKVNTSVKYEEDTLWSVTAYCTDCGACGPELYFKHVSKDDMRIAALGAWDVRK